MERQKHTCALPLFAMRLCLQQTYHAGTPCRTCLAEMKGNKLQVRASYLEIYNEDVRDLLAASPRAALELREDADGGVYAKGLHAFLVRSPADLASVLQVAAPPGLRVVLTWHMMCLHAVAG